MNKLHVGIGVGLVGLLGGGLGGIALYERHQTTKARAALEVSATRLSDCLLGGPADGDVGAKARAIELGAGASFTPDDPKTGWPGRCAGYASAIAPGLRAASARGLVTARVDLAAAHDGLADGKPTPATSVLEALEPFTRGAHDPSVPAPPAPQVAAIERTKLRAVGGEHGGVFSQTVTLSQAGVRFWMQDEGAVSRACEYDAKRSTLRCLSGAGEPVPGDVGSALAFSVTGEADAAGFFTSTIVDGTTTLLHGQQLALPRAFADGRARAVDSVVSENGTPPQLLLRDASGHTGSVPFNADILSAGPRVGGDFVVWKARTIERLDFGAPETEKPATLMALSLTRGARPITIGPVVRRGPTDARTADVCEADALFFDMSPALVSRDRAGAWRALSQRPLASDSVSQRTLSCSGEALAILDLNEHDAHLQRCTASAGCAEESVALSPPAAASAGIATTRDVVLVWTALSGATYFARTPLAELAKATPRLLVDGAESGNRAGSAPGLNGVRLFAFGEDVLVLLGDKTQYAVLIRADGKATSLEAP